MVTSVKAVNMLTESIKQFFQTCTSVPTGEVGSVKVRTCRIVLKYVDTVSGLHSCVHLSSESEDLEEGEVIIQHKLPDMLLRHVAKPGRVKISSAAQEVTSEEGNTDLSNVSDDSLPSDLSDGRCHHHHGSHHIHEHEFSEEEEDESEDEVEIAKHLQAVRRKCQAVRPK